MRALDMVWRHPCELVAPWPVERSEKRVEVCPPMKLRRLMKPPVPKGHLEFGGGHVEPELELSELFHDVVAGQLPLLNRHRTSLPGSLSASRQRKRTSPVIP